MCKNIRTGVPTAARYGKARRYLFIDKGIDMCTDMHITCIGMCMPCIGLCMDMRMDMYSQLALNGIGCLS